MTDIDKNKLNQFISGLRFDQKNKGKEESSAEEQPSEPAPLASQSKTALDPDKVLSMMSANAAPIQQFMSIQSSLSSFEPFLKKIDDAFRLEFENYETLPEETRRNLMLRAANILMDKGVV